MLFEANVKGPYKLSGAAVVIVPAVTLPVVPPLPKSFQMVPALRQRAIRKSGNKVTPQLVLSHDQVTMRFEVPEFR